jgi:hypothetical protein
LRTSLLLLILTFGMMACSKTAPVVKAPAKELPTTRIVEKAAKPSPYKPKAPRQVSVVNRETVAPRQERPQPE